MHKDGFLHGLVLGLVMWVDLKTRPRKVSTSLVSGTTVAYSNVFI